MKLAQGLAVAVLALAGLTFAGCGGKLRRVLEPQPMPAISLRWARVPTPAEDSVAYRVEWTAQASGPPVARFLYAMDPKDPQTLDATWRTTTARELTVGFRLRSRGRTAKRVPAHGDIHVFAIRAVDVSGRLSTPVWRALSPTNVEPTVQIVVPHPSGLYYVLVLPSVSISWTGTDPDGAFTQHPVKYKYLLISGNNPLFDLFRQDPDSLRKLYEPAFAGWDSVSGDTTSVQYTNLTPQQRYLFAVVAFDELGAYNTPFSLDTNMLLMRVELAGISGPRLTVLNEHFSFKYPSGGINPSDPNHPHVEMPADQPIRFNWSADSLFGSPIAGYRWALDIADINDETPRSDEETDLPHWSRWSDTTFCAVGPFNPPGVKREAHALYFEARDVVGLTSLGIVYFAVERPPLTDELLIVDDTRLRPDQVVLANPDSIAAPQGNWPTAAELDTFLFARGGVPWRYYPAGSLSPHGIFNGYRFDTLASRFLPGNTVPLAVLSNYRHVIWYTDLASAAISNPGSQGPVTGLRLMNQPNGENVLALYVRQGGKLWLLGGGAGYASMIPWDCPANNSGGWPVFSSALCGGRPELAPGRMMYDLARWRSEFKVGWPPNQISKSPRAIGGWPGAPNYSLLPAGLHQKTPTTDPLWPLRQGQLFYAPLGRYDIEFLSQPNVTDVENVGIPGGQKYAGWPLDTLMVSTGTVLPQPPAVNPCMTFYHAREHGQFVFSGFNIWSFQRAECMQLVDFVLQQVWGLSRDPLPREPVAALRILDRTTMPTAFW